MIILTKRQKEILSILLRISNGTTIKQLEESVNVSRRTIYREFNELKLDLERRGLTISNIDGKYVLQGQERDIEQLREDIGDSPSQQEMSVSERQSILAAMLLLEDEPQKIVSLAMSLKVSEGTVQRDLTEVALALGKYGITLIKKKGVGISVKGTEFQRRQVLCGILLSEINDYRFFKYIGDDQDVGGNNYFLRLLPKKRIQLVTQALNKSVLKKINIKSDHQSMQLILLTTICLERAASSDNLGEIKAIDGSLKYQSLVYQFMAEYSQIEPLKLDRKEIIYL
ncbi:HTH domain-containing protein, partial [Lactobacillus salivarius]|nr:HTH domain-containing protein [Ligilactobacillus salivarius]